MKLSGIVLSFLLFSVNSAMVSAQEIPNVWNSKDLYFYDEQNTAQKLELAPKVKARFLKELSQEEQTQFMAKFSPASQTKDPYDNSLVTIELAPDFNQDRILEAVNEIHKSGLAEAAPVFIVNNLEATIDGVVIEPKTVVTTESLEKRIHRFGEFVVRQSIPEDNERVLLFGSVKPPLNPLILINLIHQDSWVKRAHPRFKYLHDPVVATLVVEPVSGTVSEPRKITLTITVFDSRIKIAEEFIPTFGEGRFAPTVNNKQPPAFPFQVVGSRKSHTYSDKRSRSLVYVWEFKNYAIGEWEVPAQPLAYEKDGQQYKTNTTSASFVVNSQIGSLKISDMPPPRVLPFPSAKPSAEGAESPPPPVYWFDRWVKNPAGLVFYGHRLTLFFAAASVLLVAAVFWQPLMRLRTNRVKQRTFKEKIEALCREAKEENSYKKLHDALCAVLSSAFPELSSHPTLKEVEEAQGVCSVLVHNDMWDRLTWVFNGLNKRHKEGFVADEKETKSLVSDVRLLADKLGRLAR